MPRRKGRRHRDCRIKGERERSKGPGKVRCGRDVLRSDGLLRPDLDRQRSGKWLMSGVNAREDEVMLEVKSFLRGGRCGWKGSALPGPGHLKGRPTTTTEDDVLQRAARRGNNFDRNTKKSLASVTSFEHIKVILVFERREGMLNLP